ncbi:MAG: arabinogalactan endo-1,4-beta-galactosidase [Muribaculaceae bacterium]|nr:arabinogalactan endo-1,4-beta-galactosidase [Muribaculaceae bacterium]
MRVLKQLATCLMVASSISAFAAGSQEFWLGGDISGMTLDESRGRVVKNRDSVPVETTRLMKDYGMNATRLRVWVDPDGGFCSPQDVLKMALRSKALDMPVMIDFHYSDWWADPGKQNPPAAWLGKNLKETEKLLYDHTRKTLRLLKKNGVDVKWVQVGNETTHGFLWPMGRFEENPEQYASLTKAGVKAVREVFPNAAVIIHLDNGFDQNLYDSVFDSLKANGVEWDMIGMSVYPFWAMEGKFEASEVMTLVDTISNIRHLKEKYGTDVMIVETGVDGRNPEEGKEFIRALIKSSRDFTDGACKGVFYWAPEWNAEDDYRLGAFSHDMPTVIMDAFKEAAGK